MPDRVHDHLGSTLSEDPQLLKSLGRRLRSGRLDLLVGAGVSQASGFPSWNQLTGSLLVSFLRRRYGGLDLNEPELKRASEIFVESFGREAVVDAVHLETGRDYLELLRRALYPNDPFDLSTVHWELSALVGAMRRRRSQVRVYTFNFDALLESAIERLTKLGCSSVPGPGRIRGGVAVVHLHGMLGATGRARGTLVLSERDYHATNDAWALKTLSDLFGDPQRAILMVGLSLSDSRLRRVLLDRVRRLRNGEPAAEVYAILSKGAVQPETELVERLSRSFVRGHERAFWKSWEIRVLDAPSHDLVPSLLRRMRLGSDPRAWVRRSTHFLTSRSANYRALFQKQQQRFATEYLGRALDSLRRRFMVERAEMLTLGGFVPFPPATLRLAFHYRGNRRDDRVTSRISKARQLNVGDIARPEGAAGSAFISGATVEGVRGKPRNNIDLNFTRAKKAQWSQEQGFRGLLCVPVFDSIDWVPIGVVYLTSSRRSPFWIELSPQDYDGLQTGLRNIYRGVLRYESEASEKSGLGA